MQAEQIVIRSISVVILARRDVEAHLRQRRQQQAAVSVVFDILVPPSQIAAAATALNLAVSSNTFVQALQATNPLVYQNVAVTVVSVPPLATTTPAPAPNATNTSLVAAPVVSSETNLALSRSSDGESRPIVAYFVTLLVIFLGVVFYTRRLHARQDDEDVLENRKRLSSAGSLHTVILNNFVNSVCTEAADTNADDSVAAAYNTTVASRPPGFDDSHLAAPAVDDSVVSEQQEDDRVEKAAPAFKTGRFLPQPSVHSLRQFGSLHHRPQPNQISPGQLPPVRGSPAWTSQSSPTPTGVVRRVPVSPSGMLPPLQRADKSPSANSEA